MKCFMPLEVIARLRALVSNPRVDLARLHRVFTPNRHLHEQVALARSGRHHAVIADEVPGDRHGQ